MPIVRNPITGAIQDGSTYSVDNRPDDVTEGYTPAAAGLRRGIAQVKSAIPALMGQGAALVGQDDYARQKIAEAHQIENEAAQRYPARIRSPADATNASDLLEWAQGTLAEQVPIMGATLAGGLIGKFLKAPMIAGATVPAAGLESASIFSGATRDPTIMQKNTLGQVAGYSALGGVGAGALEALPVVRAMDRLGVGKAGRNVFRRVFTEAGKTAGEEALTEGAQTLVETGTKRFLQENYDALTPEEREEIWTAMASGALVGGTFGGVGGLVAPREPIDQEMDDIEANDELNARRRTVLEQLGYPVTEDLDGDELVRASQDIGGLHMAPDVYLQKYLKEGRARPLTNREQANMAYAMQRLEQYDPESLQQILAGEDTTEVQDYMQEAANRDRGERYAGGPSRNTLSPTDHTAADITAMIRRDYDGDTDSDAPSVVDLDASVDAPRQSVVFNPVQGLKGVDGGWIADAAHDRAERADIPRGQLTKQVEEFNKETWMHGREAKIVPLRDALKRRFANDGKKPHEIEDALKEHAAKLAAHYGKSQSGTLIHKGNAFDKNDPLKYLDNFEAVEMTELPSQVSGRDEYSFSKQDLYGVLAPKTFRKIAKPLQKAKPGPHGHQAEKKSKDTRTFTAAVDYEVGDVKDRRLVEVDAEGAVRKMLHRFGKTTQHPHVSTIKKAWEAAQQGLWGAGVKSVTGQIPDDAVVFTTYLTDRESGRRVPDQTWTAGELRLSGKELMEAQLRRNEASLSKLEAAYVKYEAQIAAYEAEQNDSAVQKSLATRVGTTPTDEAAKRAKRMAGIKRMLSGFKAQAEQLVKRNTQLEEEIRNFDPGKFESEERDRASREEAELDDLHYRLELAKEVGDKASVDEVDAITRRIRELTEGEYERSSGTGDFDEATSTFADYAKDPLAAPGTRDKSVRRPKDDEILSRNVGDEVPTLTGRGLPAGKNDKGAARTTTVEEVQGVVNKPDEQPARHRPTRVISGGQTGADAAGLRFARKAGYQTGGWAPKGWWREKSRDASGKSIGYSEPLLGTKYGLKEHSETGYRGRTIENIKDADATIVFKQYGQNSPGSALTYKTAKELSKPVVIVDPFGKNAAKKVAAFLAEHKPGTLNVAGSRELSSPGIGKKVEEILDQAIGPADKMTWKEMDDKLMELQGEPPRSKPEPEAPLLPEEKEAAPVDENADEGHRVYLRPPTQQDLARIDQLVRDDARTAEQAKELRARLAALGQVARGESTPAPKVDPRKGPRSIAVEQKRILDQIKTRAAAWRAGHDVDTTRFELSEQLPDLEQRVPVETVANEHATLASWLEALGLPSDIMLVTEPEQIQMVLADRPKAMSSYVRGKLAGAAISDLGVIVLTNYHLNPQQRLETLAHEVGHILFHHIYETADIETKRLVQEAWEKWASDRNLQGESVADVLKSKKAEHMLAQMMKKNNIDKKIGELRFDQINYLLSFEEWFADHVARHLTTPDSVPPKGLVDRFFWKVAQALKRLLGLAKESGYPADTTVAEFVNRVFDGRYEALSIEAVNERLLKAMKTEDPVRLATAAAAVNPMSTAAGQAITVAMKNLLSKDEIAALGRAMTNDYAHRQLRPYNPGLMVTDVDGSIRTGYQLYVAGLLKLGPQSRGLYDKVFNAISKEWVELTDEEAAAAIFEKLKNNQLVGFGSRPSILERTTASARMKSAAPAIKAAITAYRNTFKWAYTAVGRLYATGNPHLRSLAREFFPRPGEEGAGQGYHSAKNQATGRWHDAFGKVLEGYTDAEKGDALKALQNKNVVPSTQRSAELVTKVNELFEKMFEYARVRGLKLNKTKDYFPWIFDTSKVAANETEFRALIDQQKYHQHYESIGKTWAAEHKRASPYTVPEVIDLIVDHLVHDEYGSSVPLKQADNPWRNPFWQQINTRVLFMLADDANDMTKLQGFMKDSFEGAVISYIDQLVKRAEFVKRFGDKGDHISALMMKAKNAGATTAQLKLAEDFVQAQMGRIGHQTNASIRSFFGMGAAPENEVINPTLQKVFSTAVVLKNLAVLTLATITSLADPVGILARSSDAGIAWEGLKQGFKSAIEEMKGNKDALYQLGQSLGAIETYNNYAALNEFYGTTWLNTGLKNANDKFFQLIGLEQWTRMTRLMALASAREFVKRHVQSPTADSGRYLAELGIRRLSDVKLDANGNIRVMTEAEWQAASPDERDRDDRVTAALNRFVDEAILRPNAAQRPIWASDPHWMLLWHLKSFTWAFHQTILRRIGHEIGYANLAPMGYLMFMIPVLMAGELLRELIKFGGDDPRRADWGIADYAWEGTQRSGMLGLTQLVIDAQNDRKMGGIGVESFFNPQYDTIKRIDDLLFNNDAGRWEAIIRQMPGQNVWREWTR